MQRLITKIVCAPGLAALAGLLAAGCGGGLVSSTGGAGGGGGGPATPPPTDNIVTLDDVTFVLADDQRLGIVVPYSVGNADGSTLLLVFQWSLEGEDFPALPTDPDELAAALADAVQRDELQIATPYGTAVGGRVVPQGAATVELPELGAGQAGLLGDPTPAAEAPSFVGTAPGLAGLALDLLRPSIVPEPVAATWAVNPLDTPVAVLPGPDGTSALVLDRDVSDLSRLRSIDLATGDILTELATGTGEPDALAIERHGRAVLYAEHTGTAWRVARVDLVTLEQSLLFDIPGSDVVRGLVSLGTGVALVSVADSLLRLDYSGFPTTTVTVSTVLEGLSTPWGLALDPLNPQRVFVAERDFAGGRVLAVSLDKHSADPLSVMAPGIALPEALALERNGTRLLVLTDATPGDGTRELVALQYRGTPNPAANVLLAGLPDSVSSVATGADGLRLLALGVANDLSVGGGVQQRRTVIAYDPPTRIATVANDFSPAPTAGQPWRLVRPTSVTPTANVTRECGIRAAPIERRGRRYRHGDARDRQADSGRTFVADEHAGRRGDHRRRAVRVRDRHRCRRRPRHRLRQPRRRSDHGLLPDRLRRLRYRAALPGRFCGDRLPCRYRYGRSRCRRRSRHHLRQHGGKQPGHLLPDRSRDVQPGALVGWRARPD
jgi:hypothetical protein